MPDVVSFILVHNPLNLLDRDMGEIDYKQAAPLTHYLGDLPDSVTWGVCVNSKPIDQDLWDVTYPQPNDYITVMPIPEGGGGGGGKGGGKAIMRMVALVAIAVAAVYTGGLAAEAIPGGMAAGPMADGTAGYLTTFGSVCSVGVGAAVAPVGTLSINQPFPGF